MKIKIYLEDPERESKSIPSLDLLKNNAYLEQVNLYAIRLHNALDSPRGKKTNGWKHLDICMGYAEAPLSIDFLLPAIYPNDIKEIEAGFKFDNFPTTATKLVLFQPAHETTDYLLDDIDQLRIIKKGYGRGWYKLIKKGAAKIIQLANKSWNFTFDDKSFNVYYDSKKKAHRMKRI